MPLRKCVQLAHTGCATASDERWKPFAVWRLVRQSRTPRSDNTERGVLAVKMVVRGGVEPPTYRFSGGRSYRLSYLTMTRIARPAVLTGLEPATSTLTGWRALQLLYRTLAVPLSGLC